MEVKTIKDVDPAVWAGFKELAKQDKVPMGKMLAQLVENYRKESERFWKTILRGEKILSDEEADAMLEHVKKLRKERGFR